MSPRVARITLAVCLLAIYSTLGYVRTITNALRDLGLLRASVGVAFVVSAACFLWLIFRDRRRRTLRFALVLIAIAAMYAAAIWPMDSPEEKVHFIEYGVVALLAHASTSRAWSTRRRYVVSALFVAAAGWIDEGIQALLPSRFYDLRDVAFNAAAGILALIALAVCSRTRRNSSPLTEP
jgi:glucan phosphoethanolaminetransferase (alkaline phosphatase superfamily)